MKTIIIIIIIIIVVTVIEVLDVVVEPEFDHLTQAHQALDAHIFGHLERGRLHLLVASAQQSYHGQSVRERAIRGQKYAGQVLTALFP